MAERGGFTTPNTLVNQSLSFDATNAMLDLYHFLPRQNYYREIIGLKALEFSKESPDNDVLPFTTESDKSFLEAYEKENEYLSKAYFNNQPLFIDSQLQ